MTVKGFKELGIEELRRSAIEDFAVEIGATDGKPVVLAALTESGIVWADYVKQHPEVAPAVVAPAVVEAPVVAPVAAAPVQEAPQQIRFQEQPVAAPNDLFLIKMTRDNPLYEVAGQRFTTEHPYALVNVDVANFILNKEDGFRQAFPNELAEYYS